MTYQIPTTAGVLVTRDGKRTNGTLPKLLDAYQALGKDRQGSTIFLEEGVAMPPLYRGENRNSRRNLYATEMTLFISLQDKQAA